MENALPLQQSRWRSVWFLGFIAMLGFMALVLASAIDTAPVIRGAEARNGDSLTCDAAYNQREISGELYTNHRSASDLLYLFNLSFPGWLLLLAALTYGFFRHAAFSKRIRWIGVAVAVALTAAILFQWPVIRLVACAVE